MRLTRIVLWLTTFGIAAGTACAAAASPAPIPRIIMGQNPPSAEPSSRTIARLVGNLIGKRKSVQVVARQQLLAIDDAAVIPLETALCRPTTPAMRKSLRRVLRGIAESDALRGPLVRLKLRNATLRQVFTRLCVPVGINPNFYPMCESGAPIPAYWNVQRLDLNVRHQPFWTVMRRIALITGVGPAMGSPIGTTVSFGRGFSGFQKGTPICISGAFLVAIESCTLDRKMQFDAATLRRHHRWLQVRVDVLWCPGRGQLLRIGPVQVSRAVDNMGKSLRRAFHQVNASGVCQAIDASWGQQLGFSLTTALKWPSAGAQRIASLRGSIPVVLPVGPMSYRFKHLALGKAKMAWRGIRIHFGKPVNDPTARTVPPGPVWKVSLDIDTRMPDRRNALRVAALVGQLTSGKAIVFYGAGGKVLSNSIATNDGGAGPHFHYDFEITGEKPVTARLTVYRWAAAKIEVPFEFKNVPLPR